MESAREQATGLKEINEAVLTMDQGTQQNAVMVEESTASSHSLASEVDGLNRLIATFKSGWRKKRLLLLRGMMPGRVRHRPDS